MLLLLKHLWTFEDADQDYPDETTANLVCSLSSSWSQSMKLSKAAGGGGGGRPGGLGGTPGLRPASLSAEGVGTSRTARTVSSQQGWSGPGPAGDQVQGGGALTEPVRKRGLKRGGRRCAAVRKSDSKGGSHSSSFSSPVLCHPPQPI